MTLGEVLIEFVEAYVKYNSLVYGQVGLSDYPTAEYDKMHELRKELLSQLNFVETIFKKEN